MVCTQKHIDEMLKNNGGSVTLTTLTNSTDIQSFISKRDIGLENLSEYPPFSFIENGYINLRKINAEELKHFIQDYKIIHEKNVAIDSKNRELLEEKVVALKQALYAMGLVTVRKKGDLVYPSWSNSALNYLRSPSRLFSLSYAKNAGFLTTFIKGYVKDGILQDFDKAMKADELDLNAITKKISEDRESANYLKVIEFAVSNNIPINGETKAEVAKNIHLFAAKKYEDNLIKKKKVVKSRFISCCRNFEVGQEKCTCGKSKVSYRIDGNIFAGYNVAIVKAERVE